MQRVLLVYHEPGVEGSERLLYSLVSKLGELGIEASLSPLREAVLHCSRYENVYLLMFARGGHWAKLAAACRREPRVIPAWVAARVYARGSGTRLLLVYLRARRLTRLFSRDLRAIAAALEAHGVRVLLAEASRAGCIQARVDSVAALSLLPGRLWGRAAELASRLGVRVLPPFAAMGVDELAAWIASETL